jgi:hypothetical protein
MLLGYSKVSYKNNNIIWLLQHRIPLLILLGQKKQAEESLTSK